MLNIHKLNSIHGWFNEDEAYWLYEQTLGCQRAMEIGSWQGRTTYCLLSGIRDTHVNPPVERVVISVDQYKPLVDQAGNEMYLENRTEEGRSRLIAQFLENIKEFRGIVPHVLIDESSKRALSHDAHYFKPLDIIMIDGDHSYDAVCHDILGSMKLLRPGGKLCGHDYRKNGNHEVRAAVDKLLPDRQLGAGSCWLWNMPALA